MDKFLTEFPCSLALITRKIWSLKILIVLRSFPGLLARSRHLPCGTARSCLLPSFWLLPKMWPFTLSRTCGDRDKCHSRRGYRERCTVWANGPVYLVHWCRQAGVDTRTFARIYAGLAVSVVLAQRKYQLNHSTIAARVTLSREFVDFFEMHLPMLITSMSSLLVQPLCCWSLNSGLASSAPSSS